MSSRRTLTQRAEMFGFDDGSEWALEALRLVFAAPRVFEPLVNAWEHRYPGTLTALGRMRSAGFLLHQPRMLIDTVTGLESPSPSRPVVAYRLTAAGSRLAADVASDARVLQDRFPRSDLRSLSRLENLLLAMYEARQGDLRAFSARRAAAVSGFSERHARMWLEKLTASRLSAPLRSEHRDIREAAPAHWRPTAQLIRQLRDIEADPMLASASALLSDLLLERRRELPPLTIRPSGYSGSSDFDHDVRAQQLMAKFLSDASRVPSRGILRMEPPLRLSARRSPDGLVFESGPEADATSYYRPDAEFREVVNGRPVRSVMEYERRQSRTDAWTHIESFAGLMHLRALPTEEGNLRFVVEGPRRAESYWRLCLAYADRIQKNPHSAPDCAIHLSVGMAERILSASDPFDASVWRSVSFHGDGTGPILLHDPENLPSLRSGL